MIHIIIYEILIRLFAAVLFLFFIYKLIFMLIKSQKKGGNFIFEINCLNNMVHVLVKTEGTSSCKKIHKKNN